MFTTRLVAFFIVATIDAFSIRSLDLRKNRFMWSFLDFLDIFDFFLSWRFYVSLIPGFIVGFLAFTFISNQTIALVVTAPVFIICVVYGIVWEFRADHNHNI